MKENYKIEKIEEFQFGPKAVSEMTTLAMDGQRNWRQRGHLGPPDGPRGKMRVSSIAALAVRAWGSFLGYPVSESKGIGAAAAPLVIYWAMLNSNEDYEPVTVVGPRDAVRACLNDFYDEEKLAAEIAGLNASEEKKTYITWFEKEPPEIANQFGSEGLSDNEPIVGRYINLLALGRSLAIGARGPLFRIVVDHATEKYSE